MAISEHEQGIGTSANVSLDEKRMSPRLETQDICEIRAGIGQPAIACLVENISEHGAKLHVGATDLPDRFLITNYARKTKTLCRQVWRNGRHIGVRFLTAPRNFDYSATN